MIDNQVYPDEYEFLDGSTPPLPDNWNNLKEVLAQRRPSLSPSRFSDKRFREFKRKDAHAPKEKQVSESVISIIEGEIGDTKCRSGGIPLTNLDALTDGTLKPGNPDIYYGARLEQLNRKVRDDIGRFIIPSTQDDLPIAPNFFVAAKGPDGSLAVASRQAYYDGALGARGMHHLQSYGQDEPLYNHASTVTSIYHGGQLKMYTSHVTQPSSSEGRPAYHMTQIEGYSMTGNPNAFRQGVAAYRNARDWAKEQRDDAIRQANERTYLEAEEAQTVGDDIAVSPASSFVTAVSGTEPHTVSHNSLTSLNEDFNIQGDFEDRDCSTGELVSKRLSAKGSGNRSSRPRKQLKRINTNVTARQSERLKGTRG